jgi:hypothetical protein
MGETREKQGSSLEFVGQSDPNFWVAGRISITLNARPTSLGFVYFDSTILVPTLLRTNESGNSWAKRCAASGPVQCIGTMSFGARFFIS